jgi:curved DNA-binding protein CbpA
VIVILCLFSTSAYRKVCLEHHPDKELVGVEDEEERAKIEEYFKQVQEAYAVCFSVCDSCCVES